MRSPNILLQAEQPQLLQPIFVGEVFSPLDHPCRPPLDPLQKLHNILLLGLQIFISYSSIHIGASFNITAICSI